MNNTINIHIESTGFVSGDLNTPLGYVGEKNSRVIKFSHPTFTDAVYRLQCDRNGDVYELNVGNDSTVIVPTSLLKREGVVDFQFIAKKKVGSAYSAIFKSNSFSLVVMPSLTGGGCCPDPVPPYEQALDIYDRILDYLNGPVVAGKSAYALAVQCGFEGTLEDWLDSLKVTLEGGEPGQIIMKVSEVPGEYDWVTLNADLVPFDYEPGYYAILGQELGSVAAHIKAIDKKLGNIITGDETSLLALQEAVNQIKGTLRTHEAQLTSHEQRIDTMDSSIYALRSTVKDHKQKLEDISESLSNISDVTKDTVESILTLEKLTAELKEVSDTQSADITTLKDGVTNLTELTSAHNDRITSLEEAKDTSNVEVAVIKADVEELKGRVDANDEAIKSNSSLIDTILESIESIEVKDTLQDEQLEQLRKDIETKVMEVSEINEALVTIKDSIITLNETLSAKIHDVDVVTQKQQVVLDSHTEQIKDLQDSYKNVTADAKDLADEVHEVKKSVATNATSIEALKVSDTNILEKIADITAKNTSQDDKLTTLFTKVNAQEVTSATLTEKFETVHTRIGAAEGNITDLKTGSKATAVSLAKHDSRLDSIESTLAKMEENISCLVSRVDGADDKFTSLDQTVKNIYATIKSQIEQVTQIIESNDSNANEKIAEIQAWIKNLEETFTLEFVD